MTIADRYAVKQIMFPFEGLVFESLLLDGKPFNSIVSRTKYLESCGFGRIEALKYLMEIREFV